MPRVYAWKERWWQLYCNDRYRSLSFEFDILVDRKSINGERRLLKRNRAIRLI